MKALGNGCFFRRGNRKACMRYGLPYKGSKNSIAEKIVDYLPEAQNFYDLFAGGIMRNIEQCSGRETIRAD